MGAQHTSNPKAYVPPSLPLNPIAPQLDLGLDAILDRNPLGFSPSSFLGGVLLWTAERCWIAATGCVDTSRGIITLILLRGASSSRRSVRGTCSWDRSRDCSWEFCFDYLHYIHTASPTLLPLQPLVSEGLILVCNLSWVILGSRCIGTNF